MTLSSGLPAGDPVIEHARSGADRRPCRGPGAGRGQRKCSDKASTVTSSVWDTRPWAKGSSSAVAGAARMLQSGHTEVGHNTWVMPRQTPRKCGDGKRRLSSLSRGRGRRRLLNLATAKVAAMGGKRAPGLGPACPWRPDRFHQAMGAMEGG